MLLHGIGGRQNCLYSGCTILALPSFRNRIPVIVDEVTTVTGPGELIDVVITERGIAINPRRQDLLGVYRPRRALVHGSDLSTASSESQTVRSPRFWSAASYSAPVTSAGRVLSFGRRWSTERNGPAPSNSSLM